MINKPLKRFYKQVKTEYCAENNCYNILLDAKILKTPKRQALQLPTKPLASLIEKEWATPAIGDAITADIIPLTRLSAAVIDIVIDNMNGVRDEVKAYIASDLLFYRDGQQEKLHILQQNTWNPLIDWVSQHLCLNAPPLTTADIMPLRQHDDYVNGACRYISALDAWHLAALQQFVTLTGSFILGVALYHEKLSASEAVKISHLDENYQMQRWGQSEEQLKKQQRVFVEISDAIHYYFAIKQN